MMNSIMSMALYPNAPEVWDQALINGRIVHPADQKAAIKYARKWYDEQGYGFSGAEDSESKPVEKPQPPAKSAWKTPKTLSKGPVRPSVVEAAKDPASEPVAAPEAALGDEEASDRD